MTTFDWGQVEVFMCKWNPESQALDCEIQLKESEIPLMIGIWILSSTEEESEVQYLETGIHSLESRIQDCVWLAYMSQKFEVIFRGKTLMLKGIYGKI